MPRTPGNPIPGLDEMRGDMRDAYDDPTWDASPEQIRELWFDIFEIDPITHETLVSEPGAPGNDEPDERHEYEA